MHLLTVARSVFLTLWLIMSSPAYYLLPLLYSYARLVRAARGVEASAEDNTKRQDDTISKDISHRHDQAGVVCDSFLPCSSRGETAIDRPGIKYQPLCAMLQEGCHSEGVSQRLQGGGQPGDALGGGGGL